MLPTNFKFWLKAILNMTHLTPNGSPNCENKSLVQPDQTQSDFSKVVYMTFPDDAPIGTGGWVIKKENWN